MIQYNPTHMNCQKKYIVAPQIKQMNERSSGKDIHTVTQ